MSETSLQGNQSRKEDQQSKIPESVKVSEGD